jgi:hypothetical protein
MSLAKMHIVGVGVGVGVDWVSRVDRKVDKMSEAIPLAAFSVRSKSVGPVSICHSRSPDVSVV